MITNVDLTAMRYFLHVAGAGSFVGGARRAHVSAPAISKAIARLEYALDVRLFERTTRRVVLTADGDVALARCREIIAQVDALGDALARGSGAPSGPLRVAAMEVFSLDLLPAAIADLVRDYPQVVPSSYEMIPQTMIERLREGEIDAGFSIGAATTPGIDVRALGRSRGALVCGRAHPLYRVGRVTKGDLARYPSVVPRFYGAEHLPSLDQFPEQRYARRVGATIELLQMGVELVVQGAYLGYFPEISVRGHLREKRLRALDGVRGGASFELSVLTAAGRPLKPAAEQLITRVSSAIRRRRGSP